MKLPKKFCVWCKDQNYKVETTFNKIDICELCMKTLIDQQVMLVKKARGGEQ